MDNDLGHEIVNDKRIIYLCRDVEYITFNLFLKNYKTKEYQTCFVNLFINENIFLLN